MARHKIRIGTGEGMVPPFDNLVKVARLNEERGYDSIWFPDHLMGWTPDSIWQPDVAEIARIQPNPHVHFDAVATIAAVAMSTSRMRLGTSVTEPIRRHPAMLAQEWLTLDHISKGRVILGIGAGEGENIVPYGLSYSNQASKLDEALQIIRLLWSTDQPVDFAGRYWTLRSAVLGLRPYGATPPPIWVAAMGPKMLETCARYADGWIPTVMSPEEYGQKLRTIRGLATKHGRTLEHFTASMFSWLVVADSHERCHEIIEHPLVKNYALAASFEVYQKHGAPHPLGSEFYGLKEYIPNRLTRGQAMEAINRIPSAVAQEIIPHGTPEELCELFESYAEQGLTHLVLANVSFMPDLSLLRPSFAALAEIMRYFS